MTITEAQREERRGFVGASDVSAILHMNPWTTAGDVYLDKIHQTDDFVSEPADQGNRFEPAIMDWAEEQLGPIDRNVRYVHTNGWLAANLDGVTTIPDRRWGGGEGVEAKHTSDDSLWGRPGTDEIPDWHVIQAQAQMEAGGLARVWFPVSLPGRFRMYVVDRDRELGAYIAQEAERFMACHVIPRLPPADFRPSLDMVKRIRRRPQTIVELSPALYREVVLAKNDEKAAAKRRKGIEAQLLAELGDAEAGSCEYGDVTYLEQTRGGGKPFRVARYKQRAHHKDLNDDGTSD